VNERDPDEDARRLAAESLAADDPTGWFERLYVAAEAGEAIVPWNRGEPHRMLVQWARAREPKGGGLRAMVVGCGPGHDAAYVAELGFDTVAFDVSATAVAAAGRRFADSGVRFLTADLLDPPSQWREAFDLVVESYTVQALPVPSHPRAIANVASMVAPGGTLVVIGAARDKDDEEEEGPPWPLTSAEIGSFATGGLRSVRIEDIRDPGNPSVRRRRAEFRRPHQSSAG
jgi:SAM-dependent methyltransferase